MLEKYCNSCKERVCRAAFICGGDEMWPSRKRLIESAGRGRPLYQLIFV